MASDDEDEDLLEIDDLEGLRLELEALRAELGDSYVAYKGGGGAAEGDESDAEAGGELAAAASPGAALRAAGAEQLSAPEQAGVAAADGEGYSEEEEYEYGIEEEEEDEDEEAEAEARQQQQQQQQEAAWAVQPVVLPSRVPTAAAAAAAARAASGSGGSGSRVRNQQLLPPPQRRQAKQQAGGRSQQQQQQQPGAAAAAKGKRAKQDGQGSSKKQPQQQQQPRAARTPKQPAAQPKPRKSKKAAAAAAESEAAAAEAAEPPPPPISKLQAIREALEANRQLQARLRRLLASTDRAIERNATVLLQVRALHAKKNAPPAVTTVPTTSSSLEPSRLQAPIGSSCFWGGSGGGGGSSSDPVPLNPDAQALRPLFQHLPFSFRPSRWSEEERQRLREGVVQLVQEVQLQDVMQEMQQRLESGGAVGMADFERNRQRIGALTLESPVVDQLACGFSSEDWATLVQRSRLHRTTTECRLQWTNSLAPSLSQQAWSAEEDRRLQVLVEQHGQRQWDLVSRELAAASRAGVRPPLSCLQRHQQLAAAEAKEARQFGTQEGVAQLAGLVAKHGSSWKRIAEEFGGGWDPDQLMHIWRRHAQRGAVARKGKWTQAEDDTLLQAMAMHARKWSLVARLVPGRTDVQCRERYMNVLNPDLHTFVPWTPELDQQLLALAAEHTQADGRVKWSSVAAQLSGRTDKQCAIRWRSLTTEEPEPRERKPPRPQGGKKKRAAAAAAQDGGDDGGSGGGGGGVRKHRRKEKADAQPGVEGGGEGEEAPTAEAEGGTERGEQQPARDQPGETAAAAAAAAGAAEQQSQRPRRLQRRQPQPMEVGEQQQAEQQPEQEQEQQGGQQRAKRRRAAASAASAAALLVPQAAASGGKEELLAAPTTAAAATPAAAAAAAAPQQSDVAAAAAAAAAVAAAWDLQQQQQQRAEPEPAGEAPQSAPLLPAPPAVTAAVLPHAPAAAVGQLVGVWWVLEEGTGAGSMYSGRVAAWHPRSRQHSVHYDGELQAIKCKLEEETVEWRLAGRVTGPGAAWPAKHPQPAAAAAIAAKAAAAEAEQQQQQQGQQQQQQGQQQQQHPGRQRRPSARAAAAAALQQEMGAG